MTILPYTLKQQKQVAASLVGNLRGTEWCYRRHAGRRSRDRGDNSRVHRHSDTDVAVACRASLEDRGRLEATRRNSTRHARCRC
jgi:hypothetical protein